MSGKRALMATLSYLALASITPANHAGSGCPKKDHALLLPARVAIYYGYPSLINGSGGDLQKAAVVFSDYDVVVLGDGLEFSDIQATRHPGGAGAAEHQRARRIIETLRHSARRTEVYGYVDLGNSQKLGMAELRQRARLWAGMSVHGIFLDEAGYDFGVTRSRQNEIVSYVHELGLSALLNAYQPDDVFSSAAVPLNHLGGGNPNGAGTVMGNRDAFFLESFQILNGEYEKGLGSMARTARAVAYRKRFGARVFAITTTLSAQDFSLERFEFASWNALLWRLDGFGWGEPNFAGQDNLLPWRGCPTGWRADIGSRFTSPVKLAGTDLWRQTDKGKMIVDTKDHRVRFVGNTP